MVEVQNFFLELLSNLDQLLVIHVPFCQEIIIKCGSFKFQALSIFLIMGYRNASFTQFVVCSIFREFFVNLYQKQSTFLISTQQTMMKPKTPRQFLDTQKISKHLFCSICHQVFDNPTRMLCGHTFCYVCIEGWAAMSKDCPECKRTLMKRKPQKDLIAAHMVDDLMAKCSHFNCTWIGVYSRLKKHQRFCQHREKKEFEDIQQEKVVRVPDDDEIKKAVELNKFGIKKVKQNEQNAQDPIFIDSEQEKSLSLQVMFPRGQIQPNQEEQNHKTNSQHINKSSMSSQSSDCYLESNLKKMIKHKNTSNQHDHYQNIQWEKNNNHDDNQLEEEKQNNIMRQFGDISFQDDNQIQLYPRVNSRSDEKVFQKKYKNFHEINYNQPEFFDYLNNKNNEPDNSFLLERYKQEEKEKQQKQEKFKPKWEIKPLSSTPSRRLQDSDSDMENPFDEPLPQQKKGPKKHPKKYPVINNVIVLDSSDDESIVSMSKQSGEISVHLNTHRPTQPKWQQNFLQQEAENDKIQIEKQVKQLIEYRPQIQLNERIDKRERKNVQEKIQHFDS